ncbi:MAG TPA: M50 family metallopeptidase [Verrucomicrobiae bacterium]|nr:M50 family metallopeptidase [Verrucomicrobiae bacterium]
MDIFAALQFILSIAVGLLILVFLVVVHELGHAIVARRNGVVVEEFGIGFPPRAWSKKLKNGVLFTLNWLPLGGFVKLQGENDSAASKGDYGAARLWVKAKILLAGVTINWVVAVLIFTVLALTGLPKVLPHQFTVPSDTRETRGPVVLSSVKPDSPAKKAGLKAGDELLRFNGKPIPTPADFQRFTAVEKGKEAEIIYKRGGREVIAKVQLAANPPQGQGPIGAAAGQQTTTHSTWSAPIVGVMTTFQLIGETLKQLGEMIANLARGLVMQLSFDQAARNEGGQALNAATQSVTGPVGILAIIFPMAQEAGPTVLLFITGLVSLTLALMNALPIPALDGGRLFVTIIFRILKKPLTKEREELIHGTGFLVLMLLVIIITIADVGKLF